MKIELKEIAVRDLVAGYRDNYEEGVLGYGGNLNIRPAYQREFVYKDVQRNKVIETVRKNFPLNVMYWAKNTIAEAIDSSSAGANAEPHPQQNSLAYEVLDGQQRAISICQYVTGIFSVDEMFFHNLPDDLQEQIMGYKLMVYFCEGSTSEKLEWFETINIAGEKLTDQELRNAVYSGTWLTSAKKHFSKSGCPASDLGAKYLVGAANRQDYLETALRWISGDNITGYMGKHQHAPNASELWQYFKKVITWVQLIFPKYRKEMKGVGWGFLYNDHKDDKLDPEVLEKEVAKLMTDDDVTKKPGIYPYVLTRNERLLSLRSFTDNQKREAYERQDGKCACCGKKCELDEMEGDHITPWHAGGKTIATNCQMLFKDCNRRKGGK